MRQVLNLLSAATIAGLLAGCGAGNEAPAPAPAAKPADPYLAGVVTGPLGASLTQQDRLTAGKAQFAAVSEGKRRSWKGKAGSFGYIEPGAVSAGLKGNCREYKHTIYINGRANSGNGSACETTPGNWALKS